MRTVHSKTKMPFKNLLFQVPWHFATLIPLPGEARQWGGSGRLDHEDGAEHGLQERLLSGWKLLKETASEMHVAPQIFSSGLQVNYLCSTHRLEERLLSVRLIRASKIWSSTRVFGALEYSKLALNMSKVETITGRKCETEVSGGVLHEENQQHQNHTSGVPCLTTFGQ